jgi:hypothetical protein
VIGIIAVGLSMNKKDNLITTISYNNVDSLQRTIDSLQLEIKVQGDGFDYKELRYDETIFRYELGIEHIKHYHREAYEEFCLLTPDDIAQRSSINNLENYAEGSTLYKFKDKTPSHVKGAIAYNILIKELKVDNKREKIQTGQKVKKLYCKKNKYGLDAISYVADYPTEFNLPVDSDRMFNKLVTKPISSLYEAIGWIIPQLNKEPQTDLFELFGI